MSFSSTIKFLVLAIAGMSALSIAAFGQDPDDVVRVDTSTVVLNAVIRDAQNRPVVGLKRSDFKILEDGVPQEISMFEAQELPFAAVILLDTSGSMSERMSVARSAAINFLGGLRLDDMAAIYQFNSKVQLVQDFSDSRDVAEKIFDVKASGQTVLNDAILRAADELSRRPEKRKAIVVVSDGADTFSKSSAGTALKAALAANALIYTIDMSDLSTNGIQRRQNQSVLKHFAEKSGGLFISTESGRELRDALTNIVQDLGTQYTLAYEPKNLKRDGKWHELELRVARPDLTIRTRQGYNAPTDKP